MASYRYYIGSGSRSFCYSRDASLSCPVEALVDDERWDSPPLPHGAALRLALHNAHRAFRHAPFEDGRCRGCGAVLVKKGYLVWIEAPLADALHDEAEARLGGGGALGTNRRLNEALGATYLRVAGSHRYFATKREAIQWAREEAEVDLSVAREEAGSR